MQRVSESIVRMSGFRRATHKHDTNGVDINDSVSTVLKLDVRSTTVRVAMPPSSAAGIPRSAANRRSVSLGQSNPSYGSSSSPRLCP